MASLQDKKIKDTYQGLLKTEDNEVLTGTSKELTDGKGNGSGLHLNNTGDLKADGTLEFGSLKDTTENITITKFVDEADGISNNDNDTTIPTSAAVKDYVDNNSSAQDLDFTGNSGIGVVDLNTETLNIVGANGVVTSASGQTITVDTSSLDSRLTTAEADIDTNTADISTEEAARISADSNLQSQITSNDGDITTLQSGKQDNLTAGTGIDLTANTVTNTAPDQTVTITQGNNITVTGSYPDFTITAASSTAPVASVNGEVGVVVLDSDDIAEGITNLYDKTVTITEGSNITVTGVYPDFTIAASASTAPVDSVNGATGVVVLDSDDIAEGSVNLYDKTVAITGSGAATVTGTYPNFNVNATDTNTTYTAGTDISIVGTTINNTAPDQTVTLTEGDNVTITGTYPNFTISSNDVIGEVSSVNAGTGISVDSTTGNVTVTNTSPDQTVTLTGSGATNVSGTYPDFTISSTDTTYTAGTGIDVTSDIITNTAPDQTVSITSSGSATVTGTYPNFNVDATDTNTTYTAGSGLDLTGTVFSNTAPDQTVAITGSGSATITGTYPNFNVDSTDTQYTAGTGIDVTGTTITNTSPDQVVSIAGTGSTTVTGTYPDFSISSTGTEYTAGTGLQLVGTEFQNTAPDQTVTLTGGNGVTITGTYPNFTVDSISGSQVIRDLFSGTGVQTDFTLSGTPVDENYTQIYFNGVYQEKSGYTLAGNVVTFSEAPATGLDVEVISITTITILGEVSSVNGQIGDVVLDSDDISEGATNLYNQTHTGDVTGATALTIASGAVTNDKMAVDSVDSAQYVDGSIDTVHLANDVINYAKLGTEFTTSAALATNVDFSTAQVFTKTLSGATTLTFSNAEIGMVKDLVITGNHALTLPAGSTVAGTYDGTVSNLIQVVVTGAGQYWYSISQPQ
jgi:hypothetical protein